MTKTAIIPGSYDPITIGHYDIIKRASELFDNVIVLVSASHSKNTLFSPEERKILCAAATKEFNNVKVDVATDKLIVRYAKENNIKYIVRGLRMNTDFEYELQLSQIYKSLEKDIETVWFPTNPKLSYYSSSIVRELMKYNEDFSKYVPEEVYKLLKERDANE